MRSMAGKKTMTATLNKIHTATVALTPGGFAIALTTCVKAVNRASPAFTGMVISCAPIAREEMHFDLASTAGSGDAWGGTT